LFATKLSRYRLPNGSKRSSIHDLNLFEEAIAEIGWCFESLKPYLKPGKFDGYQQQCRQRAVDPEEPQGLRGLQD